MYANNSEIPPRSNTGLGVWGLETLVSWGGGKVVEAITSPGEGGDEKAVRALTPGAACPGAYSEGQLMTAIHAAGPRSSSVAALRRAVLIKDWLRGVGIEGDDRALARAAVFLAHGGKDCKAGATEAQVAQAVDVVMRQAGSAVYPTPQTVAMDPGGSYPYYGPVNGAGAGGMAPTVELGLEYVRDTPAWVWAAAAAGLYFFTRR